jgi:hypothetical protein
MAPDSNMSKDSKGFDSIVGLMVCRDVCTIVGFVLHSR